MPDSIPSTLKRERTHFLLLLQRLFSFRQAVSPFTLLLDSLEQSSKPLVTEFIQRARASETPTIYVSYETPTAPDGVSHFVRARRRPFSAVQADVTRLRASSKAHTLVILDTLNPLLSDSAPLPTLLAPLIGPQTSLLATLHTSVPLVPFQQPTLSHAGYSPPPQTLLTYLATTLITLQPLPHVLDAKRAELRAEAPPTFGLGADSGLAAASQTRYRSSNGVGTGLSGEWVEGVLVGLGAQSEDVVLGVEFRRKSGRTMGGEYVLSRSTDKGGAGGPPVGRSARPEIMLLEEHPRYKALFPSDLGEGASKDDAETGETFSLSLTEKQRRDREGVVLPYFDAQRDEGPGEGGRILYQMGEEDFGDWDEEEDEV